MSTFTIKTFADSYLFNNSLNNSSDPNKSAEKAIGNFIISCHRIDKYSESFRGVIEDIKRQQISSVLLSTLFNENVVLCLNSSPLPRAFTVFNAHDSKDGRRPKVFVDLTGRVDFKDGYYYIKRGEADKVCALISDALVYLLYRYYPNKILNNGNITLLATECYVSMFAGVLDYLRVIGYSNAKSKISFLTSIYFMHTVMNYDINDYTISTAAKIACVSKKEADAYELYLDDISVFDDVYTFLSWITELFSLRGLDLSTFVHKWMFLYGTGTEYAIEVYTSFLSLLLNAYSGSYIVNQVRIEKACGSSALAKLANAILKSGIGTIDNGGKFHESVNTEVHTKGSEQMSDIITMRNNIINSNPVISSFSDADKAYKEATELVSNCKKVGLEDKLSKYAENSILKGLSEAYDTCISLFVEDVETKNYQNNALTNVAKAFKKTLTESQAINIERAINRDVDQLLEVVQESGAPADVKKQVSSTILELRQICNFL